MKREMDLIRELVLKLEAMDVDPGTIVLIKAQDLKEDLRIGDYTENQILYHYHLLIDQGWVETGKQGKSYEVVSFRQLTPAGHDFADSVRDSHIWAVIRDGAIKAGGFSLDLLGQLAKGFIKKQIEQHTNIQL